MSCSIASWENLTDYIKLNLGASINALEFNDEEIIRIITNHTLPDFSRYDPLIRYYLMEYETNIVNTEPTLQYKFIDFDYKITKINNVIHRSSIHEMNQFFSYSQTAGDVTEFLMAKNLLDMSQIALAPHTWRYFPPDILEITKSLDSYSSSVARDFIVEVGCVHQNLNNIDADKYTYLKDYALADIMIYLGRIRTKFKNFSTPFGQVELTAEEFVQEGTQLKNEVKGLLQEVPPEDYIFFL